MGGKLSWMRVISANAHEKRNKTSRPTPSIKDRWWQWARLQWRHAQCSTRNESLNLPIHIFHNSTAECYSACQQLKNFRKEKRLDAMQILQHQWRQIQVQAVWQFSFQDSTINPQFAGKMNTQSVGQNRQPVMNVPAWQPLTARKGRHSH